MTPRKQPKSPIFNRVRVQLAELINVNPQTIGALERGDHSPSLDLVLRICETFGLPVEAIFSRTGSTRCPRNSTDPPRSCHDVRQPTTAVAVPRR
ncbi:helix-turn-helix domain-containing protein [Corynebacterium hylobatis]|uniref:Helix-turn-helix domain-containing protein n=1 Tax=Corynebacterium hylobatis TaxID=1859290 RepID=A0A430HVJ5_9CORY|nr:helix-turn-helix domain-containing protein [Corynebacterium hylobatis]